MPDQNDIPAIASQTTEQESYLLTLIETIPGTVYTCRPDAAYTMVFMSNEVVNLTGYPKSDFLDNAVRSYTSIIHPDDVELVSEKTHTAVTENRHFTAEYRIINKAGDIRWVFERGKAEYTDDGTAHLLHGTILDITERKQVEQSLEQALNHSKNLSKALDQISSAIFIKDTAGRYLYANQATLDALEVPRETVIGQDDRLFFTEDRLRTTLENDRRVLAGEQTENFWTDERSLQTKHYKVTKSPIYANDNSNKVVGLLGISTDITTIVEAEEELKRNKNLVEAIFDNTDALIFVKNLSGTYVLGNRRWAESVSELGNSNFGPDDIVGKTPYDLYPDEQARRFETIDAQVLKGKKPFSFEYASDLDPKQRTWMGTKISVARRRRGSVRRRHRWLRHHGDQTGTRGIAPQSGIGTNRVRQFWRTNSGQGSRRGLSTRQQGLGRFRQVSRNAGLQLGRSDWQNTLRFLRKGASR